MKSSDLSTEEAAGMKFCLSVPRAGSAGKRPLLVFLHGYDEGPPTEIREGVTRHGPLRAGSSDLAVREFIVVAPRLPDRGDRWRLHAPQVLDIVREVQVLHDGDPARTYLTGFSFGGNGVFDIALTEPSVWTALWPVDPTRVPERDPGLPVWFSSGEVSRWKASQFIERLRLQPVDAADGDRIYVDEGLGHVGTATSAYADARIYRWLLSKAGSSLYS